MSTHDAVRVALAELVGAVIEADEHASPSWLNERCCKAIAAARAALSAQPVPSGWQPIETATKDGSAYIIVSNGCGVWVAHWEPAAISGYRFDQPWRSVMLNHWHIPDKERRYLPPTHWMPLPAAPKPEGTK